MNDMVLVLAMVIVFGGIGYTIFDSLTSFENKKQTKIL